MHAHVEHRTQVTGDALSVAAGFHSDPTNWLPGDPRPAGPYRWRFELHAGPMRHEAIVEVGEPGKFPHASRRTVRWWAPVDGGLVEDHSDLFPRFEGTMTLRHQADDHVILEIAGDYVPPGGLVGAAADLAAGRVIAKATLHWIAEELAANLPVAGTLEASLAVAERAVGSSTP